MNLKKFISSVSALTIAASAFAGMAVTASAENDPVVVYERGTSAETAWSATDITEWTGHAPTIDATLGLKGASGTGSRTATKSISVDDDVLLQLDMVYNTGATTGGSGTYTYFNLGDSISIRAYGQDQYAQLVVGTTTYSIPNACSKNNGNRSEDNWTISMTIDTALNKISSVSIVGANGTPNVNYSETDLALPTSATFSTMVLGSNRTGGSPGGNAITSIRLTQQAQSVDTANYTVNYVCDDDTVKSVETTGAVGAEPDFSKTTVVGDDNVTYIYVSDDAEGVTIADDGTTVVNVTVRTQNTYTASITSSVDHSVIASEENVLELSGATLYHNRYIVKDGVAYKSAIPTSNSTGYNNDLTYANQTAEISYSEFAKNVVYFAEAEDITGWSDVNDKARMSGGKGGYPVDDTAIVTLDPGKYVFYVGHRGNDGSYFTVTAGSTTVIDNEAIHGYWLEKVSDEVELSAASGVVVSGTGLTNTKGIDYILIVKTGDVESGGQETPADQEQVAQIPYAAGTSLDVTADTGVTNASISAAVDVKKGENDDPASLWSANVEAADDFDSFNKIIVTITNKNNVTRTGEATLPTMTTKDLNVFIAVNLDAADVKSMKVALQ